jgi:hypothetical protein
MDSVDPHRERVLDSDFPYVAVRPVQGRLVCILDARSERRGMQLEIHPSRALRAGEIHELALTDDAGAAPGVRVDRVAYVGFVEIGQGGVVVAGERVTLGRRELGQVVGFDCTHFPNHMSILIRGAALQTGRGLGAVVDEPVVFALPPEPGA